MSAVVLSCSHLWVDWIMRTSTEVKRNGIKWTLWSQLDDLDFADDLALLSHSLAQMQDNTTCLDSTSARLGLYFSSGETRITRMQLASTTPVTATGQPHEQVTSFACLGSLVDTQRGGGGGWGQMQT